LGADWRYGLNHSFLITFALIVLALLTSVGLQVQANRRKARATELTAARMEIELLKKNLQPHFLLNTLTALSEVVEQDPPGAVRLIGDLADEFRSLSRMSAEKLIPLSQELDLCRAHLRVMSLRTGKAWRLEAEKHDPAAQVPPAHFITLIENGFAHQRVAAAEAAFVLRHGNSADGGISYVFLSPGERHENPDRVPGGTGLRYVKARLEESFSGRWSFRDGPTALGWETVIEFRSIA
jgi:LytS/YehU family sensor histidine kinase